jgi:hypothetical protein
MLRQGAELGLGQGILYDVKKARVSQKWEVDDR